MAFLRFLLASLGLVTATRVLAGPGDPLAYAAVFDLAFVPGFSVESHDSYEGKTRIETVSFRVVEAGTLKTPSGRVCAADPFVQLADAKPFTQAVPAGAFPVRLAVAHFPSGDVRVAFARVFFSDAPVVRWAMAVVEGQDIRTLKADEIFGYGVDAGTGSFFDPVAGQAAAKLLDADGDAWEAWQTEGEANGPKVIGPYSFLLDLPLGDANAVMFHSGWGDGFYASWFGYDANGHVAALVTNFAIIDWTTAKW